MFQYHALKRCGAGDVGTTVRRMLIATIGKELALPCSCLGTG